MFCMSADLTDVAHVRRPLLPKLHVLALPYPTQGHINPMMQLCRKLAANGLIITFVYTEYNSKRIHGSQTSEIISSSHQNDENFPNIHIVSIPDGLPADHPRTGNLVELTQATEKMGGELHRLVEKLMRETRIPPLSAIISDVTMVCAQEVANVWRIPRIGLRTSSASTHALYYHLPQLISKGVVSNRAMESKDSVTTVPGISELYISDIPSMLINEGESDYFVAFTLRILDASRQATWLLVNSFHELERSAIDAMRTRLPIYPIGPLVSSPAADDVFSSSRSSIVTSLWAEEQDCLKWLNMQPTNSVLYISFGSIAKLSSFQLQELAAGIEASQQPFLWVCRPDLVASGDSSLDLSTGIKGLGRIVSWAPQIQVLSHASVGCFLSHCGWNSCLESISSGVPILAWPSFAEQRMNSKLIVREWGMGMEFKVGEGRVVGREEVERVIRRGMGQGGREMRKRAEQLREEARRAVGRNGSSQQNLEAMITDLVERSRKTATNSHRN